MIHHIWRHGGLWGRVVLIIASAAALWSVLVAFALGFDSGAAVWSIALAAGALTAGLLWAVARIAFPRGIVAGSEVRLPLVWGGLVATCLASVLNGFGPGFLIAPVVEEVLKAAGVVIALRMFRTGSAARGFVFGFIVGAAFEAYENFLYIAAPDTPYTGGAMDAVAAVPVRVFLGFGLHAVTTALVGAAAAATILASGRVVGRRSALALVAAVAIHLAWDVAPEIGGAGVVLMAVDYAVIVAVFVIGRNRSLGSTAPSTAVLHPDESL